MKAVADCKGYIKQFQAKYFMDSVSKQTMQPRNYAYWNQFTEIYDQKYQIHSLQTYVKLAISTQAYKSKRILSVACGPGEEIDFMAKTFLMKGGQLVCTDFSDEMMKITRERMVHSDYMKIEGNQLLIDYDLIPRGEKEKLDIEQIIGRRENLSKHIDDNERLVIAGLADNQCLPFKDNLFDCYISNYSLHLVPDYKKQLSEALRVVKPGSLIGYSVWGRRENMHNYQIQQKILSKFFDQTEDPLENELKLGQNSIQMKEDLEQLGYKDVKIWYEPANFIFDDFDDFFQALLVAPCVIQSLKRLTEDQIKEMRKLAFEEYQNYVKQCLDPRNLEVMIIIGRKM